jgi:5-methylcytosine-specific restriction protein A
MPKYPFKVGKEYTKKDIYRICSVPLKQQRGNWDTGYTKYGDDWFIFANIGTPGRTGHDYENRFIGDDLYWYGRTNSKRGQPSIENLICPDGDIYVFYREESRSPFIFAGLARAKSIRNEIPVQITWSFEKSAQDRPEVLAEEVSDPEKYVEGSTKQISVNIYERNPQARKKCVQHYGYDCAVCGYNFGEVFGELGEGFIHVHHLKQLAEIGQEYLLDPIEDLRPVCPNCHAMLHRKRPPLSIEELKQLMKNG